MLSKSERVAKQEQGGKTLFAATQNVGRSKKGQRKLIDCAEQEVVDAHSN